MTVENYLAEAGALAGLAGVLAGFSLAAVVQLLTANDRSKLVTAGIVVFSASSVMFLYSLFVAVLSFSAAAELNRVPDELDRIECRRVFDPARRDLYFYRRHRDGRMGAIQSGRDSHNQSLRP